MGNRALSPLMNVYLMTFHSEICTSKPAHSINIPFSEYVRAYRSAKWVEWHVQRQEWYETEKIRHSLLLHELRGYFYTMNCNERAIKDIVFSTHSVRIHPRLRVAWKFARFQRKSLCRSCRHQTLRISLDYRLCSGRKGWMLINKTTLTWTTKTQLHHDPQRIYNKNSMRYKTVTSAKSIMLSGGCGQTLRWGISLQY